MPTPTIDPAAYEAAYAAVKQFAINKEIFAGIVLVIGLFIYWISRE